MFFYFVPFIQIVKYSLPSSDLYLLYRSLSLCLNFYVGFCHLFIEIEPSTRFNMAADRYFDIFLDSSDLEIRSSVKTSRSFLPCSYDVPSAKETLVPFFNVIDTMLDISKRKETLSGSVVVVVVVVVVGFF